jgi:hypothetical protein
LNLDLTDGTEQITGSVSEGTNWSAMLQADRAIYSATNPAPESGLYTMIIPALDDGSLAPGGDGCAKITVSPEGLVSLRGVLSDDTAVASASAGVSQYHQWPLYLPLYETKTSWQGSLSGWVNFTNGGGFSFLGSAGTAWFRTNSSGKFYPHGFTNHPLIVGSTFTPGGAHVPALALTNGLQLIFSGGGLPEPLTNDLSLSLAGKFSANGPGAGNLSLTVVPSTGLIGGSFLNPATRAASAVKGVVFQQLTNAGGFFLGTNTTGSFVIVPSGQQ